jgi:hypothetical protein
MVKSKIFSTMPPKKSLIKSKIVTLLIFNIENQQKNGRAYKKKHKKTTNGRENALRKIWLIPIDINMCAIYIYIYCKTVHAQLV